MARLIATRHRTYCRCKPCKPKLIAQAAYLRGTGQSLPTIAYTLHASVATVWRWLQGVPTPDVVDGRDGIKYRRRGLRHET